MAGDVVNVEQAEAWNGPEGEYWANHQARFDAAQCSRGQVRAAVPVTAAGRCVGPAPLAGAEAGGGGRGGSREEVHVLPSRRLRRAARTAVDPGRAHGGDEPAVEPHVPAADSSVAAVEVLVHAFSMPDLFGAGWRFSDLGVRLPVHRPWHAGAVTRR